ncbi:MAG: hypothetical protein ACR2RV_10215 [Verrucomicrobiales bacterium]
MATRLERYLSHGSISNVEPGRVTGNLWFIDAEEPVILDLKGNPHRDLAGTVLVFERPDPELMQGENPPEIARIQTGTAGDITASKKVLYQESIFDDPNGKDAKLVNSLCIEWYDESGTRFAIDSVEFCLYAGEPEWQMDAKAEQLQLKANTRRFREHIESIASRISDADDVDQDDDGPPLNEFEWEERLKESDRVTQAYMEALDKYQDLPNQDKLAAAAMGWNQPPEVGPEPELTWEPDEGEVDGDDGSITPLGASDDFGQEAWLDADEFEDESHPLYEKAHTFSVRLHREAQELGVLDSEDELHSEVLTPTQTLIFACMELSAKLAGALNGVTVVNDPEPGLIVAWLKRSLPIVGRALGAAETSLAEGAAPKEWLEGARSELFEIRASILDLIQEFRKQLP